jgi:cytochrome c551/c552
MNANQGMIWSTLIAHINTAVTVFEIWSVIAVTHQTAVAVNGPYWKGILVKYLSKEGIVALKAQVEEGKTPPSKRWYCPNESCQK